MSPEREVRVDAVISEDVKQFLKDLGILTRFEQGEYHCQVCNDLITYENIKLIFPADNHEVGFVCKKPGCFVNFALE